MLEAYLPVPSCPLSAAAAAALRADNAWLEPAPVPQGATLEAVRVAPRGEPGVYLFGFGGYVREQILPHLRDRVVAAADHKAGLIRRVVRNAFDVVEDATSLLDAIARDPLPLVIIATYHSDHARQALEVLEARPDARVFIEKPAAVRTEDARLLARAREAGAWIDVGYNRRYAAGTSRLRTVARRGGPLVLTATVKELKVPPVHWYLWENQGTRITGNVCHWIDLARHVIGAPAMELTVVGDGGSVAVTIMYADGSLASITATDRGDDLAGVTERIELRGPEASVTVDDFRRGGVARLVRGRRDKGHHAMYAALRRRWLAGEPPAYPAQDIEEVVRVTETASTMLRRGERHRVLGGRG